MGELLTGVSWIILYFVVCVIAVVLIRFFTRIEDEPFRKLLHCVLLGSLSVWVAVFQHWWLAALSAVGFALLVYPILCVIERIEGFSAFITERKAGEIKASLLEVFGMFAAVLAVGWGLLADRFLVLGSIYAWGFGDAAAALVGKRYGKHKFKAPIAGGKKSKEGTAAMWMVSFVSVLVVLGLRGGLGWSACVTAAVLTATVSAGAELFSPGGWDTVTCPLLAMISLILCVYIFGGVGL